MRKRNTATGEDSARRHGRARTGRRGAAGTGDDREPARQPPDEQFGRRARGDAGTAAGESRAAKSGTSHAGPSHGAGPGRAGPGPTGGEHAGGAPSGEPGPEVIAPAGAPVAWRTTTGWRVGDEEVSDLTSAMVLADLLAADLPSPAPPGAGQADGEEHLDPRKLQETVAQLEHALTVRVRVEQAIGVLAERHRLRPRQAFELLRSAARARGRRVLEVASEVVDSATNPLLRIPEELAKPPAARRRPRLGRHSLSD